MHLKAHLMLLNYKCFFISFNKTKLNIIIIRNQIKLNELELKEIEIWRPRFCGCYQIRLLPASRAIFRVYGAGKIWRFYYILAGFRLKWGEFSKNLILY